MSVCGVQTLKGLERPVRSTSASMNACWSRTTERMPGANAHCCLELERELEARELESKLEARELSRELEEAELARGGRTPAHEGSSTQYRHVGCSLVLGRAACLEHNTAK
jgi:hypothetical protein